ncbi:hypothetical protein sos41_11090 [Alphaproteobacteria bacterium SO-S41]|nr:hypothetical protein sos41_11090 [Alphaproteobacteria bacterium SO-S41]
MLAVKPLADEEPDYAEAEAALAALAEQYPTYASADVTEMKTHLAAIESHLKSAAAACESLFAVAHNVKGQGASFGYELMTELGEALCGAIRDRSTLAPEEIEAIRTILAACDTVLTERLTGEGGARGRQLLVAAGVTAS